MMMKNLFAKGSPRSRTAKARLLNIRLGVLILLLFTSTSESSAQGANFWAEQQRIPEYLDLTEEPPYLIADMNQTVHAFNAQPIDLSDPDVPKAIVYRQWTIDNGWTYPNDILYDRGAQLNLVGATSDQSGRVHLIVQKNGEIYYVQNHLALAHNAASWPDLIFVSGKTSNVGLGFENVSAIATDPTGDKIVIVFCGREYGNGLYFTSSLDSGATWTEPYPIYLTGDPSIIVTDPRLYVGDSGLFHAVWSTFLETGFGGPGYYANFNPEAKVWSEPMELDVEGIRTPSVVEANGEIFVSYHHINVNGMWWRKSSDGGKTWSFPEQFSSRYVGTNGGVSFVVDSASVLHAFFGQRIDDNNHGMWHFTFTGGTWAGVEAVTRGPQRREKIGGNGFDPRSARAVIVNGNVVLVSWGTDGIAGMNGAWFSYKRLDVPELPAVILEGPTSIPLSTAPPDAIGTSIATTVSNHNTLDLGSEPPQAVRGPQISIFIGVLPALLLLAGIVLRYYFVHYRSK